VSPLRLPGYAGQAAQPPAKITAGLINKETNEPRTSNIEFNEVSYEQTRPFIFLAASMKSEFESGFSRDLSNCYLKSAGSLAEPDL